MDYIKRASQWIIQEKYHGKYTKAAAKDIARLQRGEPVDYIIGFVEFLGCKINLDGKVLIPRPETEHWTHEVIDRLQLEHRPLRILDMFSGSGCIGIALLAHLANATVDFTDISKDALKQIAVNCKANRIPKKRYAIFKSDVFSNVTGYYDGIVANPPYIPKKRIGKVQSSVLQFEPYEALFGGDDGLVYIKALLDGALDHLQPGGVLFMEFDTHQKPAIEKIVKKIPFKKVEFFTDQYKKARYLLAQR